MGTEVFEGTVQVSSTLHVFLRGKRPKRHKRPRNLQQHGIIVHKLSPGMWARKNRRDKNKIGLLVGCFDMFRLF
jgi:hypothetical protein